ncbi:DNA gyrase subunit A [Salmonella enterica subsp. diarizonae]|uniref:DNA gyrase subunit A n=1 Tax=Salmonella diarizonae TaxID=59204 RepID=A0A379TWV7_SALDZ|nr:DNA gyrase subunit A [Salmonella enterica subsp. diarizonae]
MKTWWVCNALLEPVDDEELDAIDGSVAEGDEDIAPEAESDDDVADDADE